MKSYILRAKPDGKNQKNEFLEGRLSIGWPCGLSFEGKSTVELSKILTNIWPEITKTAVSMVEQFIHIPINSIVLTPSLQDRSLIHIFRTISKYKYDGSNTGEANGNPHFIEATLLKTVVRDTLPEDVLRSLSGARKTLSKITQYYDLLDEYVNSDFKSESLSIINLKDKRNEAMSIIIKSLSSSDESIRLQAAIAVIRST